MRRLTGGICYEMIIAAGKNPMGLFHRKLTYISCFLKLLPLNWWKSSFQDYFKYMLARESTIMVQIFLAGCYSSIQQGPVIWVSNPFQWQCFQKFCERKRCPISIRDIMIFNFSRNNAIQNELGTIWTKISMEKKSNLEGNYWYYVRYWSWVTSNLGFQGIFKLWPSTSKSLA